MEHLSTFYLTVISRNLVGLFTRGQIIKWELLQPVLGESHFGNYQAQYILLKAKLKACIVSKQFIIQLGPKVGFC